MATRAADLKRRLEAMGFVWETAAGGGSHFKIKRDGLARPGVLALHNGLRDEVNDVILRKLARQLGVSFESLKTDG